MTEFLGQLRLVFGFFTVLPLRGKTEASMEQIAAAAYLLPVVAVVLGSLEGLTALAALYLFGSMVAAAFVLSLALLLTGFHHSDGLADVGDALMAHGDRKRRLEVLKDRTMGIGALGAAILTYLITWAALTESLAVLDGGQVLAAMVAVEVCARLCLLLTAAVSSASHEGSGSAFIASIRGWRTGAGLGISVAVLVLMALFLPIATVAAVAMTVVAAFLVIALSAHWFGGANGDVLGASVEWGRMAALLGTVLALAL